MPDSTKSKAEFEPSKKMRVNLFIEEKLLNKLDYMAGMEFAINKRKVTRTDVVNEGLQDHVAKWEKKNGEIKFK